MTEPASDPETSATDPAEDSPTSLRVRRVLSSILAGLVVGAVVVIVAISFAALVFSGALADHMAAGIGLSLFGAAVVAVVAATGSSFRSMVATPQDSTAAVIALIAAAVVAGLPAGTGDEQVLFTVIAAISLTTIATGVFFFLLGRFRLGGLIRFIPYPVIGGFLAGTGWLLSKGAIEVMAGQSIGFATLGSFLAPAILLRWLPGTIFAAVLLIVLRRYRHVFLLPGLLLAALVTFYAALLVTGTSFRQASERGLLLGPFPAGGLWRPLDPDTWALVEWSAVVGQLGSVAPVLIVGAVALLLNATGLELAMQCEVDLNRELRTAGVANILAGLGGGLPGFQTLSLSALGHRMAPSSRLVGWTTAAVCALSMVAGGTALSSIPRMAVGGLLLFLGLAFLIEWVVDARGRLPTGDYLVVLMILVVIATIGFLESVGLGIVIAVVLFVVNYSRVDIVRHALSGSELRSNVVRPFGHREILQQLGERVLILRLQGFLFFGTANGLVARTLVRARDQGASPLRFLVLDFRPVTGLDSSAVSSFAKLRQLGQRYGFDLALTQMSPTIQRQLEQGGVLDDPQAVRAFPELDRGLEWCENRLLAEHGESLEDQPVPLERYLAELNPSRDAVADLLRYFERLELDAGHYLMRRGDAPDAVYVVESGRVTVQIEIDLETSVRLLSVGPGSLVGELEMYRGRQRTTSAVTETPAVVHRISARSLGQLEQEDPDRASAFHRMICRLLAERLTVAIRTLQALLR